ncbi:MAG TPA: LptF/LptG family permease [Fimbriimonadaceae bacterium]|nr:LptF/LptG family permease [Fimbriimonadaceae bacterium]
MLREMIVPFLIGTLAVVLMFQINMLIYQYKNFQLSNVPLLAVFQVILYKTPEYLSMTLPVGMSLASSLAISRLARESELTAMRSAGVSILRVVRPIVLMGILVAIGNYFVSERLMPAGERLANQRLNEIGMLALNPTFKSNVQLDLGNYSANFGSVERGPEGSIRLSGILLITRPRPGEIVLITAESGIYKEGVWVMRDAYLRAMRGDTLFDAKPTKDVVIEEPINVANFFGERSPNEQTVADLAAAIKERKSQRLPTTQLEVDYHVRFSVPAACIVFALTGPVFAVWLSRAGAFVGVLLSIVLVLVYYNAFIIATQIIGYNGILNPILSAWLPNILFVALGLLALRRAE